MGKSKRPPVPWQLVITRKQLDVVRDHGIPVTFTEPGRAIVAGIPVLIRDPDPTNTILICTDVGVGPAAECDGCGAPIVVHPSSPRRARTLCVKCGMQEVFP